MHETVLAAVQEEDEGDLGSVMAAADLDGDGTLNYEEFIAATANLSKLERETNILSAFKQFDTDHSGALSKSEVMAALTSMGSSEQEIEVGSPGGSLCQVAVHAGRLSKAPSPAQHVFRLNPPCLWCKWVRGNHCAAVTSVYGALLTSHVCKLKSVVHASAGAV